MIADVINTRNGFTQTDPEFWQLNAVIMKLEHARSCFEHGLEKAGIIFIDDTLQRVDLPDSTIWQEERAYLTSKAQHQQITYCQESSSNEQQTQPPQSEIENKPQDKPLEIEKEPLPRIEELENYIPAKSVRETNQSNEIQFQDPQPNKQEDEAQLLNEEDLYRWLDEIEEKHKLGQKRVLTKEELEWWLHELEKILKNLKRLEKKRVNSEETYIQLLRRILENLHLVKPNTASFNEFNLQTIYRSWQHIFSNKHRVLPRIKINNILGTCLNTVKSQSTQ